jgi:nucleoside 2-deoxyribosyltransferase
MARPRCYLASPLGFTDDGLRLLDEVYLPRLRTVVEPVNPWELTSADEVRAARGARRRRELWHEIGARNAAAIASCTLLVAYLEGQELDGGTAAEVGYAAALGVRCYGLRSDRRLTGEPDARVNLQVEYFIAASGGTIVRTLEKLVAELRSAVTAVR